MLTYRTFRNTDPPILTALWRSRAGQRGLKQPVSVDLFEQLVFAKIYFERAGLFVACDDDRPVGFAHAGFGPNEKQDGISTDSGVICLLLTRPDCAEAEVAAGLLNRCEEYLRGRGATHLYGGGVRPLSPFYLGLYGGSEAPGVLESDAVASQLYVARGYREVEQTLVLERDLSNFEAPIDRRQMEVRRRMMVEVTIDAPTRTWWEACLFGEFDLTRFEVVPRGGGPVVARVVFRGMDPAGGGGVGRAAGMIDLFVEESYRRRGLSVFLLSEACRQFARDGILLVEVQVGQDNQPALSAVRKLGFREVGKGRVFLQSPIPMP